MEEEDEAMCEERIFKFCVSSMMMSEADGPCRRHVDEANLVDFVVASDLFAKRKLVHKVLVGFLHKKREERAREQYTSCLVGP